MTLPRVEDRCANVSRRLEEPVTSTASRVRRWLLVEQPGPWGREALFESRLDPVVAGELNHRAKAARARPVLVRRGVTAAGDGGGARRWFAASSEGVLSGRFTAEQELLGLDLEDAFAKVGAARHPPVFLVCTNGKHDPCCAEFGRPVYRRLVDELPDTLVFECSHIGGDRFAANVVCLPDGTYYGRVPAEGAVELVHRHVQGEVDLDRYRGRSIHSPVEQAAEIALRRQLNASGLATVTVVNSARVPHGDDDTAASPPRWHVTLVVARTEADSDGDRPPPGTWAAEVARTPSPLPRNLTCHGRAQAPPVHEVRSLTPVR